MGTPEGPRQAQGSSQATAAMQAQMLDAIGEAVIATDPQGIVTYANAAAERLYGWPSGEMVGREVTEITVTEESAEQAAEIMAELRAGRSWTGEFWVRRRDGSRFPAQVTDTPVLADDGSLAGIIGVSVDITERKQTEARLAHSEALLREAQRISHVGHWRHDVDSGTLEWLADEVHEIHGLTEDEWGGTIDDYLQLLPPEDRPLLREALEEVLSTGTSDVVHRVLRPDGEVRYVRHRSKLVSGADEPRRVVGTCQDVTDQEALRQALRERVKELTSLVAVSRAAHELEAADELCQVTGAALVLAMQYPDEAVVAVALDDVSHTSGELSVTGARCSAPIVVDGEPRGEVRVGYAEDCGGFSAEEQRLVEAAATTLASWLQRHETAAALAESEARFRRLFDHAADVIYRYRVGENEGFDYVSPAIETVTGFTVEEHLADPNRLDLHIGVRDRAKLEQAMAGRTPEEPPLIQHVTRDGTVRWTEHRLAPVHDEHGHVVAVEGIARDVTERLEAARALEQRAREQAAIAHITEVALSADRVGVLFDTAVRLIADTLEVDAVAVYEWHHDEDALVLCSGAGWDADVVGRTRLPTAAGSVADAALALEAPAAGDEASGDPSVTTPFLHSQGIVDGSAVVIGGKERPFGALGVYTRTGDKDVSRHLRFLQTAAHILAEAVERARAEDALERSEQEFRTLAEHAPDIIARYDREYRHRYVNPQVENATGMPAAACLGRTVREVGYPTEMVELWEQAAARVFATGEPTTLEYTYPHPQQPTAHQSRLIPEFDTDGRVETVLSVTRDITELRQAEAQRRDVLNRIVAAQEEERARIGEDIHDDSIQVMTAVGMRLEALKRQLEDPEALGTLERLDDAVHRSIQRLRSLMFALRPPELDRDGLVTALRTYLETTTSDEAPRWELVDTTSRELPAELRAVLYRIAQEAITNARKHAEATRITITLDEIDDGIRLQVGDDGRGFDPDRLDEAGPHHIGATAMLERAQAAGGRLEIHSTPGAGTVVDAWVPHPATPHVPS